MGAKVKDSATAVWTANPTLDIDQIAVSPDIAENMNLVDGGYILVWRDPILRDGGLRYMRVKIDDNLRKCVSINPAMDKGFDGDFCLHGFAGTVEIQLGSVIDEVRLLCLREGEQRAEQHAGKNNTMKMILHSV